LREATENVSDNLVKFLRGESWQTSGMLDFAASNFALAPMIIDCGEFDTKYFADELEWNAQHVPRAESDLHGSPVRGKMLRSLKDDFSHDKFRSFGFL
jgi:hypothetical protein